MVESRRGGGGYIRIRKVLMNRNEYLMHFYHAIGDRLNRDSAVYFLNVLTEKEILTPQEARLLSAALSDNALAKVAREERDILRADLLKTVILQILSDREG